MWRIQQAAYFHARKALIKDSKIAYCNFEPRKNTIVKRVVVSQ